MNALEPKPGQRFKDVHFTEDTLAVDLLDGRTIIVPLVWHPSLLNASPQQRNNWQISGGGYGIHWPDIDEDLSSELSIAGTLASRVPCGRRSVWPILEPNRRC